MSTGISGMKKATKYRCRTANLKGPRRKRGTNAKWDGLTRQHPNFCRRELAEYLRLLLPHVPHAFRLVVLRRHRMNQHVFRSLDGNYRLRPPTLASKEMMYMSTVSLRLWVNATAPQFLSKRACRLPPMIVATCSGKAYTDKRLIPTMCHGDPALTIITRQLFGLWKE